AEMIAHWCYPVESHDVITDDGYILNMLRIPRGLSSPGPPSNNSSCNRPPILLVHGLLVDSGEFVMNPPVSSPGMILADAGFDVFLLNVRGTTYSQRHVNLTSDDNDFWKFTTDEMARFDAPAAIEAVLRLNGAEQLYWIGHSQGTRIGFLLLSEQPEYNRKVLAMFQLAPVGTFHWARGLVRPLLWLYHTLKGLISFYERVLGSHEIGLHIPWLLAGMARIVCHPMFQLCKDLIFLGAGPPAKSFNFSRVPVYVANFFVSTSMWNILHYGQ
ncbi:hypothetical protein PMAYCL1PPCAC_15173, partial [Pristionchus mayeri]